MNVSLKKYKVSSVIRKLFIFLALAGALTFIIGLTQNPERAWANFLIGYFYFLSLSLGGLFFAALQHITGSYWSVTVRRISEVFIAYLPISLALFLVLLFGLPTLFEWTHHEAMIADVNLAKKMAYLNTPFFIVRHLALYAAALLLGGKIVKNSIRQDEEPNPALTLQNIRLSASFIILFAITYTLASIDLMMSLSPHWFSTIFGVYCWAGLIYSTLAAITIIAILLRKKGALGNYVTEDHFHDLGKLMFAFLVFWGYVAFSQYMLIWYANLPEETFYFIAREGNYKSVSLSLMLGKFVIPFFLLITRPAKRRLNWLLFVAVWFMAAEALDVYWMVMPTFFDQPVFGWTEVGIFLGFFGLFSMAVSAFLARVSPVAINDPWMHDALHHHQ